MNISRRDATIIAAAPAAVGTTGRRMLGLLEDAGLLLLLALAFPLVVLVVGAPVALIVWLLTEIRLRWL